MIVKLIGLGAAGNKAAITAVDSEIIEIQNVMLLNSTMRDIPAEYQNRPGAVCHTFQNAYGGCGKERSTSYDLCRSTLEANSIELDKFLGVNTSESAELVVIVTSTEGGTGSGSAPLIADFIRQVYGISVHVFGFDGFEDDVRGMRNTVDFFKEMKPTFTVECIKNAKFLAQCNNNKIKAEKEANNEFCRKIAVLMGLQIRDSSHNIDPTDLLKLSTEEGYMIIESYVFSEKIKTTNQFRNAVVDMCDNSKALDVEDASQKKLGVIINIKEDNTDYINYVDVLTERFGIPYEKFEHIQHEDSMPEFIAFIAAGMKMPIEEVEATYNKYKDSVQKVDKTQDSFFNTIKDKQIDPTDKQFDLAKKKDTISASAFFGTNNPTNVSKIASKASGRISDPKDEF